jgi:hypothetical protein
MASALSGSTVSSESIQDQLSNLLNLHKSLARRPVFHHGAVLFDCCLMIELVYSTPSTVTVALLALSTHHVVDLFFLLLNQALDLIEGIGQFSYMTT